MIDVSAAAPNVAPPRKAPRDVRRQQLIDATLEAIARKGYSAVTVADVAKTAGLSAGIINFHFESKEKLLAASLQHLAEEYQRSWTEAIAGAGPDPARQLSAMLLADFNEAIFTPRKLAAWIGFWGETQSRPVYDAICGGFEAERTQVLLELCAALIKDGGYTLDPGLTSGALDALGDGLWYGMVVAYHGEKADTDFPRRCVMHSLSTFFPKHFKTIA